MNFFFLAQRYTDYLDAQGDHSSPSSWGTWVGLIVVIWFFWKVLEEDLNAKKR